MHGSELHRRELGIAEEGMAKIILVADDNPTIRRMLCRMLEAREDYDWCAKSENGEAALAQSTNAGPIRSRRKPSRLGTRLPPAFGKEDALTRTPLGWLSSRPG